MQSKIQDITVVTGLILLSIRLTCDHRTNLVSSQQSPHPLLLKSLWSLACEHDSLIFKSFFWSEVIWLLYQTVSISTFKIEYYRPLVSLNECHCHHGTRRFYLVLSLLLPFFSFLFVFFSFYPVWRPQKKSIRSVILVQINLHRMTFKKIEFFLVWRLLMSFSASFIEGFEYRRQCSW